MFFYPESLYAELFLALEMEKLFKVVLNFVQPMKNEDSPNKQRHWSTRHAAGHLGKGDVNSEIRPLGGDISALKPSRGGKDEKFNNFIKYRLWM